MSAAREIASVGSREKRELSKACGGISSLCCEDERNFLGANIRATHQRFELFRESIGIDSPGASSR